MTMIIELILKLSTKNKYFLIFCVQCLLVTGSRSGLNWNSNFSVNTSPFTLKMCELHVNNKKYSVLPWWTQFRPALYKWCNLTPYKQSCDWIFVNRRKDRQTCFLKIDVYNELWLVWMIMMLRIIWPNSTNLLLVRLSMSSHHPSFCKIHKSSKKTENIPLIILHNSSVFLYLMNHLPR